MPVLCVSMTNVHAAGGGGGGEGPDQPPLLGFPLFRLTVRPRGSFIQTRRKRFDRSAGTEMLIMAPGAINWDPK